MKIKQLQLLFLMLMICASLPANAVQNPGKLVVKGESVDSLLDESIPYATVRIAFASSPSNPVKVIACDGNGKFSVDMEAVEGRYVLSVEYVGKSPAKREFSIPSKENPIDFGRIQMGDKSQKLDEVTVLAQKPLVKMDVDKLTYSMQEDPDSKTNNALDMFRKVPMVTVDGEDNIKLKGSSNYKIYLNGKPSNLLSGSNASTVLKSMPASSIKSVEVITDPGSKYDAEGVGGIINIVTAKNTLQGYAGNILAGASTLGHIGGGGYMSLKAGKFGITANYSYNHRDQPEMRSYNERFTDADMLANGESTRMVYDGKSKFKGPFQYGYLEGSYEIDTLNLFTVGVNVQYGRNNSRSNAYSWLEKYPAAQSIYKYSQFSTSKSTFGSTDVNVDYQHSTKKKDELLTLSYRFSKSPNDSEGKTEITDAENYYLSGEYPKWNINDAATVEHTAQVDYTTPLFKTHTLEAGVKYINRRNQSNTTIRVFDGSTDLWEDRSSDNDDFLHVQHIYSAYVGYLARIKSFGVKAGLRAEGTRLKATFNKKRSMDFSTNYFDLVPNLSLTYTINQSTQMRLGYNMRIQRPGIWYLNPYINDIDPQNISQGNPNLDSEKANGLNINFSKFTAKYNLNLSFNYTFVNNVIESIVRKADFPASDPRSQYNGALWNTYGNIGRRQDLGVYLYGSTTPVSWFQVYLNAGVGYTDINSVSLGMSNHGYTGNAYLGTQFSLPKDFRINLDGGCYSPWIQLQGKGSTFYFTNARVSKDFLKKKLTLTLSAQNPFWKEMKWTNKTFGEGFRYNSVSWYRTREFRLSVSFKFGEMKGSIKKVRRGISNDDTKAGGDQSSPGQGK